MTSFNLNLKSTNRNWKEPPMIDENWHKSVKYEIALIQISNCKTIEEAHEMARRARVA